MSGKCPRCVQVIHRGAELCPHCGFGIAEADRKYGATEVHISMLTDHAGLMRKHEREQLRMALERFRRKFPQLFLAVYTGTPDHGASLRQFGFWLLNRAAFDDVPVQCPNDAGILLVIDPDSKTAGLTWGYLLDPYLSDEDVFESMGRAHGYWLEGSYADGAVRFSEQLTKILQKRSSQAKHDPAKFARRVAPPKLAGEIARRIREGHRHGNERRHSAPDPTTHQGS
jgi:uncharacterized membrane protein YgcG